MRFVALVAARDEADRIRATVTALYRLVDEVVVIDDGSKDSTGDEAALAGARVVRPGTGLGTGGALAKGMESVEDQPEAWLLADGDLGDSAALLAPLMAAVDERIAEMAVAVLPRQGGGFGMVKRFSAFAIRRLSGFVAREPLSGQRAIKAEVLSACRPIAPGYGVDTALTIDAARLGFSILEVPIDLHHRATGRDIRGFAHRGRQGWDILRAVVVRAVGVR